MTVGGHTYHPILARVPRNSYRPKVALAKGRVGATASLEEIARASGAVAAINGCFFDAYTPDAVKPPYHHLLTDGELVHHGNVGTTLGFGADGSYRMEPLSIGIRGTVGKEGVPPRTWYAYRMNHPLRNDTAAILYSSRWVGGKTPAGGVQVVVAEGMVQEVSAGPHVIPPNGYV
ncbi:MAG: hypothetical protein QHJ73_16210, partial [Armatimonadota bacterium]|nr:hypothetical protein [Armatimonadota bacterium]